MEFRARPLVRHSDDPNFNLEQKRERDYIVNARLGDNSLGKFSRAIIQHFFKAPAPKSHPGYGMPRPETRESNPFRVMMQDLQRDPSMLQISSFPSLTNPIKCESGNEFCEILGSSACSTCIEKTNRYIGDELQRIMFPKMDLTRRTGTAKASPCHEGRAYDAGTETKTEGVTFSGSSVCAKKKGNTNNREKCSFQEKCQT